MEDLHIYISLHYGMPTENFRLLVTKKARKMKIMHASTFSGDLNSQCKFLHCFLDKQPGKKISNLLRLYCAMSKLQCMDTLSGQSMHQVNEKHNANSSSSSVGDFLPQNP